MHLRDTLRVIGNRHLTPETLGYVRRLRAIIGLGSDQVALKSQVSLSRSFLGGLVFLLMPHLMSCECFLVVLL